MIEPLLVHATAVAIGGRGILLRGPSGAGKSDLALRLIDGGARLIADDQSELRRAGRVVIVRSPAVLAGLLEVRGIGIVRLDRLIEAPLALCVDLVSGAGVERMPENRFADLLGLKVPLLALCAFEASAAAKVRIALRAFPAEPLPAILGQ